MRILLVEDDELLGKGICTALKQENYIIDWVKDGAAAENALHNQEFDAVVLDLGLPKISGLDLLRKLRRDKNNISVLILTARDTVEDRVKGLDMGADDYLTKPFDIEELCARLRAQQRRKASRSSNLIQHKDITLDPLGHSVKVENESVSVSRREFALLQVLLEQSGRVLSRDYLTQVLYTWDEEVDSNALEVHIHNLRKKFGNQFIITIRGVGYMVKKPE